jgi:hypothetical protein
MTAVLGDDLPELHSFATGLRRDHDAVTNGLTLLRKIILHAPVARSLSVSTPHSIRQSQF